MFVSRTLQLRELKVNGAPVGDASGFGVEMAERIKRRFVTGTAA